MFILFLILIIARTFISSPAFPELNASFSILLSGFLIIWTIRRRMHLSLQDPVTNAILIFLGTITVAMLFAPNKHLALGHGVLYLSGALLFLLSRSFSPEERHKTVIALVMTGVTISILAFYQYFFGFQSIRDYLAANKISDPVALDYISQNRVYSPFVNPNMLGSYLLLIIPLALTLRKKAWIAAPLIIGLIMTQSIGATLSLFIVTILYFLLRQGKSGKGTLACLAAAITAMIAIVILRSNGTPDIFQPLFSFKLRLDYWRQTWHIIQQHPLIGGGLGHFNLPYARYAHNLYLQLWAETGLPGIMAFLLLMITLAHAGWTKIKNSTDKTLTIALICSACGFLIHNLVDFSFYMPEISFIWCVLLGLLLG
jgi:putative inorganic carbon (HCO3(-)) transporter